MNIIAITACPTGVAHTYLAESNLKKPPENWVCPCELKRRVPLKANIFSARMILLPQILF